MFAYFFSLIHVAAGKLKGAAVPAFVTRVILPPHWAVAIPSGLAREVLCDLGHVPHLLTTFIQHCARKVRQGKEVRDIRNRKEK